MGKQKEELKRICDEFDDLCRCLERAGLIRSAIPLTKRFFYAGKLIGDQGVDSKFTSRELFDLLLDHLDLEIEHIDAHDKLVPKRTVPGCTCKKKEK